MIPKLGSSRSGIRSINSDLLVTTAHYVESYSSRQKRMDQLPLVKASTKEKRTTHLDPWEIIMLLPLRIPFHFISWRKFTNYFHWYKRNALNSNRTKKKLTIDLIAPWSILSKKIRNTFKYIFEQFPSKIEIV